MASSVGFAATFSDANWISMGGLPGADGNVFAAVVDSSGNLYIGGGFTIVGNAVATDIARWNGSSWSALGSRMDSNVLALAVSGTDLYAGGEFTTAGGTNANYIAKWDGSSWSALGSGVAPHTSSSGVDALALSGSDLYAAGSFMIAGGKVSTYVARAIVNPAILTLEADGFGGYLIHLTGSPGGTYRLQRAPTLNGPWVSSAPQTAPGSGVLEFWDIFPPPGQGFYRAVQP